jgi:hypothetical protein
MSIAIHRKQVRKIVGVPSYEFLLTNQKGRATSLSPLRQLFQPQA